jgi:hypothetical protein
MQLSLVEQFPELKKCVFLDIFAKMSIDPITRTPTLRTLGGQRIPPNLKIRCRRSTIVQFPEGTVYKLDVRLVDVKDKQPYFSALRSTRIQRAIEFFDHNLLVQRGVNSVRSSGSKQHQIRREF